MRRYRKPEEVKEKGIINIYCQFKGKDKGFELESGSGRVYENDLLVLTLAELINDDVTVTEYLDEHYPQEKVKGKRKRKKSDKDMIEPLVEKAAKRTWEVSETDKKLKVEQVFEKLRDDSKYKKRFYDMLSVLDAGYVSDRKADANHLFREIYTMPVIVFEKTENFTNAVKSFCSNGDCTWTRFKSDVLSNFTIYISRFSFDISASTTTAALDYGTEVDKDKLKKIFRWTEDIRIIKDGEYSESCGFTPKKDWRGDM